VVAAAGAITDMTVETKEILRDKIVRSRRSLNKMDDPATAESLKAYIEELERRLLLAMGQRRTG
jgi:hypothetical protein